MVVWSFDGFYRVFLNGFSIWCQILITELTSLASARNVYKHGVRTGRTSTQSWKGTRNKGTLNFWWTWSSRHGSVKKGSWFDAQSWQPEVALELVTCKWLKNSSSDESTLVLKPMSRVTPSLKKGTSGPTKWTLVQQRLYLSFDGHFVSLCPLIFLI